MTTYALGRVYKVTTHLDSRLYIGSTTQTLAQRMTQHRNNARRGKESILYNLMRELGDDKFVIVLIAEVHNVTKEMLRALEHQAICEFDTVKNGLNAKYEQKRCEHDRERTKCKECGGGYICMHQREKSTCVDCHGASVCEHNKQRAICKDCNGTTICEHGKQRPRCRDCNGSAICQHDRERTRCKDCHPCKYCDEADTARHRRTAKHIQNFILA